MRVVLMAIPVLLIAAPASAQIWGGTSGGYGTRSQPRIPNLPSAEPVRIEKRGWGETRKLRRDIDRALDSGQISKRDAKRLRREANQIDQLQSRWGRDGLSDAEAAELATRRELLRDDVAAKRSGQR